MLTRRTRLAAQRSWTTKAGLLVMLVAAGVALGGCVYSAEPAPGSPPSPQGYSTEGFPPPATPPAPGEIGQPQPPRGPAAPVPDEGP